MEKNNYDIIHEMTKEELAKFMCNIANSGCNKYCIFHDDIIDPDGICRSHVGKDGKFFTCEDGFLGYLNISPPTLKKEI